MGKYDEEQVDFFYETTPEEEIYEEWRGREGKQVLVVWQIIHPPRIYPHPRIKGWFKPYKMNPYRTAEFRPQVLDRKTKQWRDATLGECQLWEKTPMINNPILIPPNPELKPEEPESERRRKLGNLKQIRESHDQQIKSWRENPDRFGKIYGLPFQTRALQLRFFLKDYKGQEFDDEEEEKLARERHEWFDKTVWIDKLKELSPEKEWIEIPLLKD